MKPYVLAIFLTILGAAFLMAGDDAWMTDHAAALEKAKVENKMALLSFTKSDSSEACAKLQNEIYQDHFFKEFAEKNLVLVRIDFPHDTTLPDNVRTQNDNLAGQYAVKDYPAVVVLNSKGAEIGRLGYIKDGAVAFVTELKKIKRKA